MSREEHNKIAKIDNLIWEMAEIIQPNSFIKKEDIEKAKNEMLKIFKN